MSEMSSEQLEEFLLRMESTHNSKLEQSFGKNDGDKISTKRTINIESTNKEKADKKSQKSEDPKCVVKDVEEKTSNIVKEKEDDEYVSKKDIKKIYHF